MMRVVIEIPVPDKSKLRMLSPPPLEEHLTEKVFGYITPTKRRLYDKLLKEKEMKMAEAIRKGLKLFLEGNGQIDHITPNFEALLYDAIALMKGLKLPTQPRSAESEQDYIKAKKDAEARSKEIKKAGLHANFQIEVIPELKEKLENMCIKEEITKAELMKRLGDIGFDSVPFSVQMQDRPKPDEKGFHEFLKKAELNRKQFKGCKWKVKV